MQQNHNRGTIDAAQSKKVLLALRANVTLSCLRKIRSWGAAENAHTFTGDNWSCGVARGYVRSSE
jgi:hypothetical protein